MVKDLRRQLEQYAELDYKQFNEKLLPGVWNVLGVRMPKLREIAKQIAKKEASAFLDEIEDVVRKTELCYEEKMVYGLVIGYTKMSQDAYRQRLDTFVPVINNWGVCDSCCMTYKWMKKQPEYWWDYLVGWIETDTEFGIRFGLVCMLNHFIEEAYIQKIFTVCNGLRNEGYYAKMAAAWLISMCFVKFPECTYDFLQTDEMDVFTHNKSIQKTCESYRVTKEWKAAVRALKRKNEY